MRQNGDTMKKKLTTLILGFFMLIMLAVPQLHATATPAQKDISSVDIMFLHDTHSHLDTFTTVEGTKSVSMGGFRHF